MLLQYATAVIALSFGPHMPKLCLADFWCTILKLSREIFCESSLSLSTLLLSFVVKVKGLIRRPKIMVPKILPPVSNYHMSWT